ncbi:MAG: T9SS type A sorting domain-containing protein [Ignavibacteria bacterium]
MDGCATSPTCNLRGNGGAVINVYLDNNEFISTNGNAAVILNAATGTVKNTKVTDYFYSFFINNSSIDLYNNELNSSLVNSTGLKANAMSHINLGINGSGYFTGGQNKIYNSGTNSKNIHVDNSFFNIHRGYNDLSIPNESATLSKHLFGYFPALTEGEVYPSIYSRYNCFNLNHINGSAIHNVNWNNTSNQVDFLLTPYSCGIIVIEETGIVAENETGESDTIMMMSDFEQEDLSADQELYDSLNIEMRKGEYENVVNTSKELISTYADSLGSNELTIDAVSKLYSASLQIDLNNSQIEDLKTYYETIILNHPENPELLSKVFYFIQKSKVVLEDYQSALNGFQQIMTQNPYSYEALIASWDYDATSLQLGGGSGGGEKSNYEFQISNDKLEEVGNEKINENEKSFLSYLSDDPNEKFDDKIFTKEDRKIIRKNVYNSLETSRDKSINNIKGLEKKLKDGKASKDDKDELQIRRELKEISKPKNPKDITEHSNNMNNDLEKIIGVGNNNESDNVNLIPTEYNLSQNYPNPFNPTTKINFDLPEDAKISLIVYDILGREIKTIINSEFKTTGKYTVEFNGNNLASGVYFYRFTSENVSGGKEFSVTKRMVLLK